MKTLQRGVTLIELVIVMAIFAILYGLAAPSFSAWMINVQIRTASESIQNGLQLARAEAIRRNAPVYFWLTSAANPPTADWMVGCSNPVGAGTQPEVAFDCPGMSTQLVAPAGGPPYNWIQLTSAAGQQTAIPQLTTTPGGSNVVTFNSVGMVTANLDGSAPLQKIHVDVAAGNATTRPLEVWISGGQIRMCDPNLALAADPRGCQ